MTIEKMKELKIGDKIVKVRKSFQNYDHSKIPCEPIVYTISWQNGSEHAFSELVKLPFYHSGDKIIYGGSAGGIDNRIICENYETIEDYILGEYNKEIIVDNQRWPKGLGELLDYKRTEDYVGRKKRSEKLMDELEKKYGK